LDRGRPGIKSRLPRARVAWHRTAGPIGKGQQQRWPGWASESQRGGARVMMCTVEATAVGRLAAQREGRDGQQSRAGSALERGSCRDEAIGAAIGMA
jgi:hypothetical protein